MMKLSIAILILILMGHKSGASVPTVSVLKFVDKSSENNCRFEKYDWYAWREYLGDGFKDILVNELSNSNHVEVLERETIGAIYGVEHELVNAEEDRTLKKKKFKKAKYSIVGSVTEYEYCARKQGGSVHVGGIVRALGLPSPGNLAVGFKGAKAKVGIVLRVVDNETGRILKSVFKTEEVEDSGFDINTDYGDYSDERTSPLNKAARRAIEVAAREVLKVMR